MRSTFLLSSALGAALLLGPALAQAQPTPTPPAMTKPHRDGSPLRGVFTPQQRAMYMQQARHELRQEIRNLRRTFRKEQVGRIAAMSDTQRTALKAEMQAKWDALPQARKDRIEQRIAMRQQNHQDRIAPVTR